MLNQELQCVLAIPLRLFDPKPVDLGANILLDARVNEVPRLHALSAETAMAVSGCQACAPLAPTPQTTLTR